MMNEKQLTQLLFLYRNALEQHNVEQLEVCTNILLKNLPKTDQSKPELRMLLSQLKQVHAAATNWVSDELVDLKQKMDSTRSTKARDKAYSITQAVTGAR
ncbi:MAG: hypothetical protein ACK5NC_07775 [Vibrio sp.]